MITYHRKGDNGSNLPDCMKWKSNFIYAVLIMIDAMAMQYQTVMVSVGLLLDQSSSRWLRLWC